MPYDVDDEELAALSCRQPFCTNLDPRVVWVPYALKGYVVTVNDIEPEWEYRALETIFPDIVGYPPEDILAVRLRLAGHTTLHYMRACPGHGDIVAEVDAAGALEHIRYLEEKRENTRRRRHPNRPTRHRSP